MTTDVVTRTILVSKASPLPAGRMQMLRHPHPDRTRECDELARRIADPHEVVPLTRARWVEVESAPTPLATTPSPLVTISTFAYAGTGGERAPIQVNETVTSPSEWRLVLLRS